ncbi:MAG: ATP-binding protein [Caldilineaceae bacterium]
MLLNRTRELAYLDRRYAQPKAEFVVLYGRRRVGKTTLIYEWSRGKPALYFFAARLPDHVLLQEFGKQVAQALGQPDRVFPDWSSVFVALAELARAERFIVVIDEYPYLAESSPGLSTVLQRAWDTTLQHSKLFLCLTGSAHSVMRREILEGQAPLYRRHTWAYELLPLQPSDYHHFFPGYTAEQIIESYSVLGGMPRNVTTVNPQTQLLRNITNEILDPAGGLFNEVPLLLHEELKGEVDVFSRVLETIAAGAHTRQEVAAVMQITLASAQHYLNELQTIGVLEHRLPLTRVQSAKRQGSYHIVEPFLRFWHRWIAPHRRLLEINQRQKETLQEIRLNLPYIVAPVWETVARQHLLVASGQGRIPFAVQEIGSWWTRDAQVDAVGVNRQTRQVIFGEARWRATDVTAKDVELLVEKGLAWLQGDTARWEVYYAFFAKSFGQIQSESLAIDELYLFTPEEITDLKREKQ